MSIVQTLGKYALNMNNINSINAQYKSINRTENNKNQHFLSKNIQTKEKNFIPIEDDKLFWIFFIIKYGMDEYTIIKRTFQKEKTDKFNIINLIKASMKDNKKILIEKFKPYKISIPDMINDIGNSVNIVINSFIGLCCFFNINIILIKNKFMTSYLFNDNDQKYNVIYYDQDSSNKFSLVTDTKSIEQLTKYYKVSNLEKPIKGISSYKKSDLQQIAKIFGINIKQSSVPTKDKTKQMLYNEIQKII